jgi:hypothetical protein
MLLEHDLVIHFVDVIAGKQHDVSARVAPDDVDILKNRVRCADVPHRFGNTLASRKDVETFITLRAKEIPTHLKVANKAMSLILGRNGDTADPGVQSIRKREVDNARFSPEVDGWFGTSVGQLQ